LKLLNTVLLLEKYLFVSKFTIGFIFIIYYLLYQIRKGDIFFRMLTF